MKKVLITGAKGFIGRHCIPKLISNDFEVHATDIQSANKKSSNINWHQIDLLDQKQVQNLIAFVQPSHLLHFAWYAIPGKYNNAVENISWVEASLELLQAFHNHGGRRVVMAGSCAEYDWKFGYCSEKYTPLAPNSLYGVCKNALQCLLSAFSCQTGLSCAWGRIFFLYGPYEHPSRLVSSVIKNLLQKQPAFCTHGNQMRDFLHVEDVASAFVALLKSDVSGPVNIASGLPVTIKEIIFKIADKLGQRELIRLDAIPTGSDEPLVLFADTKRLLQEVGWVPKFTLESGMEHTITWWKKNLTPNNFIDQ